MFRHPWGTSEDDLTGDFFGLMKYLPEDRLLAPFLSLIQSHYPDRNIAYRNIESAQIVLWPEYQIPGNGGNSSIVLTYRLKRGAVDTTLYLMSSFILMNVR